MQLISESFEEGDKIPSKYTCDGENVSPHLGWDGAPVGVQSFALICSDPDAPGGDWIHWIVMDIPSDVNEIEEGEQIESPMVQIENDFGKSEYGGPCPPSGEHRYVFTLYALDQTRLDGAVTRENLDQMLSGHMMDKAILTGVYSKEK